MPVLLLACVDADRPGEAPDVNALPIVVAAGGGSFPVGTAVTLDGGASQDPEGSALDFDWSLIEQPNTGTQVVSSTQATVEVFLNLPGRYRVALAVSDEQGATAFTAVILESVPPAVTVTAGGDVTAAVGELVALAGSAASDDGAEVALEWQLVQRPAGSTAALAAADTLTPSFVPDQVGVYVAQLGGSTEFGYDNDQVSIFVPGEQLVLDLALVDLEYSEALDRLVLVTTSPSALHLIDPVAGTDDSIALAGVPTAVSIEPGGLRAAVGHDGAISIVDLVAGEVEATHLVSTPVADLVFDGIGRVHAFAPQGASYAIHSIALADGSEALNYTASAGRRARLNPVRTDEAYGLTETPGALDHYFLYEEMVGFRDRDYPALDDPCGDLWFTDDGATIVTRCATLYEASLVNETDMQHVGSLADAGVVAWADHGDASNRLAVLTSTGAAGAAVTINLYGEGAFGLLDTVPVPAVVVANGFVNLAPRLVAYAPDESELYVVGEVGGAVVILRVGSP